MQNSEELIRTRYPNRNEWLLGRTKGIGSSDAAAIVGMSPWLTATQLWNEKTSNGLRDDISNSDIERGILMEPVLRDLFGIIHPEFDVTYNPFDTLYQKDTPFIFATLDAEIMKKESKEQGFVEFKSVKERNSKAWDNWHNRVPDHYYVQILHQFLATNYEFGFLYAALLSQNNSIVIREYEFYKSDCTEDMNWLKEAEYKFWDSVKTKRFPSTYLIF